MVKISVQTADIRGDTYYILHASDENGCCAFPDTLEQLIQNSEPGDTIHVVGYGIKVSEKSTMKCACGRISHVIKTQR